MAAGEDVPDRDLILPLMSGVGHEYDVVVVMISSQHRTMSLKDAQFLFLMHEQRIDQLNSTTQLNIAGASANFTANQPRNYDKKVVAILVQITEAMAEEEMCYKRFDQGFQAPNPSPQANYVQQQNSSTNNDQFNIAHQNQQHGMCHHYSPACCATSDNQSDQSWYAFITATFIINNLPSSSLSFVEVQIWSTKIAVIIYHLRDKNE
ncbi:hypothetical protein ACOSQ3_019807 [Xanthoceras sorbifolium]